MAWVGVVGTVIGAILGSTLGYALDRLKERRDAARSLASAKFNCLDRLIKIRVAADGDLAEQLRNELDLLGVDMDRYRDAIADSPGANATHLAAYERMIPILLKHDVAGIDMAVAKLRDLETV